MIFGSLFNGGVVTAGRPGIAAQNAPTDFNETFHWPVRFKALAGIFRTAWRKSALGSKKGGKCKLISAHQIAQELINQRHWLTPLIFPSAYSARVCAVFRVCFFQ